MKAVAVVRPDPGQEHGQRNRPDKKRWALHQNLHLLPPAHGVLPLPADILQGFCRLPVQLRCPYSFPSAVGHISERDPRAGEMAHRLHSRKTVRSGLERLLRLVEPAERQ